MSSVSRHSGRPSLDARRHGIALGPRDMPLEAKRFRHVAVTVPIVAIGRGIAVRPRQKRRSRSSASIAPFLALPVNIPSVSCKVAGKGVQSGGGEWLTDRRPDLTRLPRPGEPVATETS